MATTTNYAWETPDDTDLVKDGAAAIRTLGSSIDTTTKALNPSTTLGDIEYRSSTANTNTRLGIGTTGQVLTVSGGVPSWATPASGSTFSGASVIDSGGNQSIATGTWTTITFNSELYDTDSYHSTSTNTGRLTIPTGKTGYYVLNAQATFFINTTGFRQLRFLKNGSFLIATGDVSGSVANQYPYVTLNTTLYLAAGDYIELQAYQNSGGNLNVSRDQGSGGYQINYLGA